MLHQRAKRSKTNMSVFKFGSYFWALIIQVTFYSVSVIHLERSEGFADLWKPDSFTENG